MAIKGKARPRGGKAVSRGPKPVYVPVRIPLYRKRGFWITLAVIIAVGSLAGIGYGLAKERTSQREKDLARRLATQMQILQSRIDPILAGVGTQSPPQFNPLPALGQSLDDLSGKKADPTADSKSAKTAGGQAKQAADQLGALNVTKIVGGKGFDQTFVTYATDAQTRMTEGLRLLQQVAAMIQQAAVLSGEQRATLLASTKGVLDEADKIVGDGYSDYISAQTLAGTFTPTLPGQPGGLSP